MTTKVSHSNATDTPARTGEAPVRTLSLRNISQQSLIYLIGNIGARAASFIMLPFYTRFLSPAEYGIIELLELTTQIGAILFGLAAIGSGLARLYYDYDSESERGKVVVSSLVLTLLTGGAQALAITLAASPLSRALFHTPEYASLLAWTALSMVLGSLVDVAMLYHRMHNRATLFVVNSLAMLVATIGLNIYFIGVRGYGIRGFVASKLLVFSVSALFVLWITLREVGVRFAWSQVRSLLRIASPLIVAGAALFVIHSSDRFFLTRFAPMAEVGTYSLAYKFGFLVAYLAGEPFSRAWGAAVFGYTNQPGWQAQIARVGKYAVALYFFVALGIALFAEPTVKIMAGKAFGSAAPLIPIIAAAYAIRGLGEFFCSLFLVNKRAELHGLVAVVGSFANIALNILLVPRYGAAGAAWATLASFIVYSGLAWWLADHEHRIPLSGVNTSALVLFAAAGYGATQLLDSMWTRVAASAAVLAAFAAVLLIAGYIPREAGRTLRARFAGRGA